MHYANILDHDPPGVWGENTNDYFGVFEKSLGVLVLVSLLIKIFFNVILIIIVHIYHFLYYNFQQYICSFICDEAIRSLSHVTLIRWSILQKCRTFEGSRMKHFFLIISGTLLYFCITELNLVHRCSVTIQRKS